MKKYHLISLIALTSIALAGCEWDSNHDYNKYVINNSITTCPNDGIGMHLGVNQNIFTIPLSSSYCAYDSNGNMLFFDKDKQNQTEFMRKCTDVTTIKSGCVGEYCEDIDKCKSLLYGYASCLGFGSDWDAIKGDWDTNNDRKVTDEELKFEICSSELSVCLFDETKDPKILCRSIDDLDLSVTKCRISEIECFGECLNPLTSAKICGMTECPAQKDLQDLCNKNQVCDYGRCVNKDKCVTTCGLGKYCDQYTGECKDMDPCASLKCDYNTQYCKPNEGSYKCASISFDPCAMLNCTSSQYCAKVENDWRCVDSNSCDRSCNTAAYSCLPDELAKLDPGNCGGCSADNEMFNCYKQFKNANVSCENGQCKSSDCYEGFYRVNDKDCYPYGFDDKHCNEKLDCTDPENYDEHWTSAMCKVAISLSGKYNPENNKCVAMSCETGYHLYNDGCEEDSLYNCGSHGKGCSSDSFKMICDSGKCKPVCEPGTHVNGEQCEVDDNNNCGSHGNVCGTSIFSNSSAVTCQSGACIPIACESNYHIYLDVGIAKCEQDDMTNCGAHGNQCDKSTVAGSESVSCVSGVCKPDSCTSEFEIYEDGNNKICMPKSKECEDDLCTNSGNLGLIQSCNDDELGSPRVCDNNVSCLSSSACGYCTNGTKQCNTETNKAQICANGNWTDSTECNIPENANCINADTCEFECVSGYHLSDSQCVVNECETDAKRCSANKAQICKDGTWTENPCSTPEHATPACIDEGVCAWNCDSDYSSCGNTCVDVQTDMNNCGGCGEICNTDKVDGSTSVACVNSQCVATDCSGNCSLTPDGRCECSPEGCVNNTIRRCENNADNIGVLSVCRDNTYVIEICPDDNSCRQGTGGTSSVCTSKDTCCGECRDDTKRCDGATSYKTCSGGVWGESIECSAGGTCSGNGDCGTSSSACPDEQENCGSSDDPVCSDLSNDSDNCGACGYVCSDHKPENALATCVNRVCKYQCKKGYHLTDSNTCEKNSPNSCGSATIPNAVNCNTVQHSSYDMTCTNEGRCQCLSSGSGVGLGNNVKICDCTNVLIDGTSHDHVYQCAQNCKNVKIDEVRYDDCTEVTYPSAS